MAATLSACLAGTCCSGCASGLRSLWSSAAVKFVSDNNDIALEVKVAKVQGVDPLLEESPDDQAAAFRDGADASPACLCRNPHCPGPFGDGRLRNPTWDGNPGFCSQDCIDFDNNKDQAPSPTPEPSEPTALADASSATLHLQPAKLSPKGPCLGRNPHCPGPYGDGMERNPDESAADVEVKPAFDLAEKVEPAGPSKLQKKMQSAAALGERALHLASHVVDVAEKVERVRALRKLEPLLQQQYHQPATNTIDSINACAPSAHPCPWSLQQPAPAQAFYSGNLDALA